MQRLAATLAVLTLLRGLAFPRGFAPSPNPARILVEGNLDFYRFCLK
jgi:hypothetical protein